MVVLSSITPILCGSWGTAEMADTIPHVIRQPYWPYEIGLSEEPQPWSPQIADLSRNLTKWTGAPSFEGNMWKSGSFGRYLLLSERMRPQKVWLQTYNDTPCTQPLWKSSKCLEVMAPHKKPSSCHKLPLKKNAKKKQLQIQPPSQEFIRLPRSIFFLPSSPSHLHACHEYLELDLGEGGRIFAVGSDMGRRWRLSWI